MIRLSNVSMNTDIIAKPGTLSTSEKTDVESNTLSVLTRSAAHLSKAELEHLQASIAGWLTIRADPEQSEPIDETTWSPPARGWLESRMRKNKTTGKLTGPYYTRRWWGPTVNGKRKKYGVYLGKNPDGPTQKK